MAKPIIEVEGLSKLYHLGLIGETTLRDSVERLWCTLRGKADSCKRIGGKNLMISPDDPQAGPEPNTIWALKDVSFSVERGEILGIIGRNGAGKSTLLKILSRITEPTKGTAVIRGKASSLLEVGTGFHPELTGRENVYLNGAILGMRKHEIDKKFDEIVAFSEIEKFIDTPVKRYSSGMYVRLAFAVAAHLDPEILLVDEVLAVGDAQFQKKCLGKMGEAAKGGRTVLFVSHNMAALATLCPKSIVLNRGKVAASAFTREAIRKYLELDCSGKGEIAWIDTKAAPGNERIKLRAVRVVCDGKITSDVSIEKPVYVEIEFANFVADANLGTSIHLLDALGGTILAAGTPSKKHSVGLYKTTYVLPANFLNNCRYGITVLAIANLMNIEIHEKGVINFSAHETAERGEYLGAIIGAIRPIIEMRETKIE